ncbi:MAG: metal-dependent hydrolase [Candidatus Gottesmanbacteria bacterium]
MTTPTHILTGAVIAKLSMDFGLVPNIPGLIYPLGILTANIPDIDVLFIKFPNNHRASIFHVPLLWALTLTITYLAASFFDMPLLANSIIMAGISILSHFFLDSFDMSTGIAWFAPLDKTFFSILPRLPRPITKRAYIRAYLKHSVMIAEGVVVLSGIIAFWKL